MSIRGPKTSFAQELSYNGATGQNDELDVKHLSDETTNALFRHFVVDHQIHLADSNWVGLDVVGHEFMHGRNWVNLKLTYNGESGALNESFSDVLGELLQLYWYGGVVEDGVQRMRMRDAGGRNPIRDLCNPTAIDACQDDSSNSVPCPETMSDFLTISTDNGGVHMNSSIANRAWCAYWKASYSGVGAGLLATAQLDPMTTAQAIHAAKVAFATHDQTQLNSNFEDIAVMAVAAAMANPVSLQAPSAGACAMQAAWHLVNVLPTPAADCNDLQDLDADGIADGADNCVFTANPSQADADFDDVGDLCDQDRDGDGVVNDEDNCPDQLNPGQQDAGNDGEGDACDEDADNDGLLDDLDNCPLDDNPDQIDSDADGDGDACDPDTDGDDVWGFDDNCPFLANADQADVDGDDIGDVCDPCPAGFDEVVASSSGNPDLGVGPSLVLSDLDGDGVADGCDAYPLTPTAVSIAGAPVPPGGLAPNLVDAIMNVALGGGIATVPVALPESPPVGSDDDTLIVNATLPPGISAALVGPHGAVESGAHGPGAVTLKGKRMRKKPLKLWLYGPPGTTADVSVSIEVGSSHDEASPCAGAHDGVRCAPEGLPGVMGLCLEEECATSICGDLLIDHADGEECEDGNAIDGDGCDNDCRYSCHNHLECGDDNERCNGDEMCINHVCQYGAGITCDDDNACTENVCVDSECSFPLIEGDGDGDGPARACGGDCHDTNPDVHSHQLGAFTVGYCQFGSTCPPDEVSFDYDCDRLEEAVDIDLAGTCQPNGSGGCRGSGWVSLEVTPCGESADYQTCTFNGTDCDATIAPLTQACR